MDDSPGAKQRKLTPTDSAKSSPEPSFNTTMDVEISANDSPISRLPLELLSAIIDYVPKTQWASLELVNRSFRDAVYSSWQSMKEFDIDKDVWGVRQSFKAATKYRSKSDFLPSILAKLLLRSPMVQSIIGFPLSTFDDEVTIQHTIRQFTNLKRIDFGECYLKSVELVEFLTSSASRDQLKEITLSPQCRNWPATFIAKEHSESQASRLKLEKFSLKKEYGQRVVFLDTRIVDLIDHSSLIVLVLVKVAAPSDYLLSLIRNCNHLQQLQFSFMGDCRCKKTSCVHLDSSKQILEAIPEMENLDSLKIGLIEKYRYSEDSEDHPDDMKYYLDIEDDLPILIKRLGWRGRLVELGLLHTYYCSDEVIEGIAQHLAGLKSLHLFAQDCQPSTLVSMIKKMVNLEKLTINRGNDDYSGDGRHYGRKYEEILEWDDAETLEVLEAVATYLQNLKSFHMRWWRNFGCLDLLTRMEHLEELSVIGVHGVKVESEFSQLRSLKLHSHIFPCDKLVAAFLKHTPGLRRFVLCGSASLPDCIPTTCPRLREFYTPLSCSHYMEKAIQAVIDGCPEFEQLQYFDGGCECGF